MARSATFVAVWTFASLAVAGDPVLVDQFSTGDVHGLGIAWDTDAARLLVLHREGTFPDAQLEIHEFSPAGSPLGSFPLASPPLVAVNGGAGLEILPGGDLLVVEERGDQEYYRLTRSGMLVSTVRVEAEDPEAIAYHPSTGTLIMLDEGDSPGEYGFDGMRIRSLGVNPQIDTRALAVNSLNGNIYAMRWRFSTGEDFDATLVEFDLDGQVVGSWLLHDPQVLAAADGMTFDPAAGRLYAVHADAALVRVYEVPEPSAWALSLVAVMTMAGWAASRGFYGRRKC